MNIFPWSTIVVGAWPGRKLYVTEPIIAAEGPSEKMPPRTVTGEGGGVIPAASGVCISWTVVLGAITWLFAISSVWPLKTTLPEPPGIATVVEGPTNLDPSTVRVWPSITNIACEGAAWPCAPGCPAGTSIVRPG